MSDAADLPTSDRTGAPAEPATDLPAGPVDRTGPVERIGPVEPAEPAAGAAGRSRARVLAVTAALLFVADLVSKVIVVETLADREPVKILGGLFYLTHTRNTGAAFSFAEGATVVFSVIALVVVVVIVRTASRLRSTAWAICLGLILGGAAGNLVDRLFRSPGPLRGAVVDWISLLDPHGRVFPIWNFADSGISCGGVLAVLLALLGYELDGRRHRRGGGAAGGAER